MNEMALGKTNTMLIEIINQVNERNHIWKDKNTRLDHQAQHHGGKGSLWNRHNIAELDGKNPSLTAARPFFFR